MRERRFLRSLWPIGALAFALSILAGSAVATEPASHGELLAQADSIKTSQPREFARLLSQLKTGRSSLTAREAELLRYLEAWSIAYAGDYENATPLLKSLARESKDATLRFRAEVTVANVLANGSRHEEAFVSLNRVLSMLPQVTDRGIRDQALQSAALLFNEAGQYEIGLTYANRLLAESADGKSVCIARHLALQALRRSGRTPSVEAFQAGVDACMKVGETLWASLVRLDAAHALVNSNRTNEAIDLLKTNYSDALNTNYTRVISEFDALLANAYWQIGDWIEARKFAQRAIDGSVRKEFTRPLVEGYRLLFLLARQRGDLRNALDFLEKYAAADKGHLNEAGTRALAFHVVEQQVQARKAEIAALSKRNQVLQLQQTVSKTAAQTRGLLILLLLSVLAFIAMWLYKTKRSQLHFMKLARRDGLTGIFNRAHFGDAAEAILAYCRKGEREACVVLIDLDHFKLVNDTHGHSAGDVVLKRTVQACQAHLRSIDIIGRLGGEEFGIVLPDCDPAAGRELAERFRLAIADLSNGESGVGFPVSASFGVTSSRWSGYNLKQLIIHADKALYVAKDHGRNRVEVFDGAGTETADPAGTQPGSFDRRRA